MLLTNSQNNIERSAIDTSIQRSNYDVLASKNSFRQFGKVFGPSITYSAADNLFYYIGYEDYPVDVRQEIEYKPDKIIIDLKDVSSASCNVLKRGNLFIDPSEHHDSKFKGSASFQSVGDYLEVHKAQQAFYSGDSYQNAFTLEFWIKPTDVDSTDTLYQTIFSMGQTNDSDGAISYNKSPWEGDLDVSIGTQTTGGWTQGKLHVRANPGHWTGCDPTVPSDDGEINLKSTTVLSNDTWYHVAIVRDSVTSGRTSEVRLYINGVKEASDTWQSCSVIGYYQFTNKGHLPIYIGAQGQIDKSRSYPQGDNTLSGVNFYGHYEGFLNELRISRIARYTKDTEPVPSAPFVIEPSKPTTADGDFTKLLIQSFQQSASDDPIIDKSTKAHVLNTDDTVVHKSGPEQWWSWSTSGYDNWRLHFSEVGAYITVPYSEDFDLNNKLTRIDFWMRNENADWTPLPSDNDWPPYQMLLSKSTNVGGVRKGWWLYVDQQGYLWFELFPEFKGSLTGTSELGFEATQWRSRDPLPVKTDVFVAITIDMETDLSDTYWPPHTTSPTMGSPQVLNIKINIYNPDRPDGGYVRRSGYKIYPFAGTTAAGDAWNKEADGLSYNFMFPELYGTPGRVGFLNWWKFPDGVFEKWSLPEIDVVAPLKIGSVENDDVPDNNVGLWKNLLMDDIRWSSVDISAANADWDEHCEYYEGGIRSACADSSPFSSKMHNYDGHKWGIYQKYKLWWGAAQYGEYLVHPWAGGPIWWSRTRADRDAPDNNTERIPWYPAVDYPPLGQKIVDSTGVFDDTSLLIHMDASTEKGETITKIENGNYGLCTFNPLTLQTENILKFSKSQYKSSLLVDTADSKQIAREYSIPRDIIYSAYENSLIMLFHEHKQNYSSFKSTVTADGGAGGYTGWTGTSTSHFTSESAFKLLKYNISERNITEETTLWKTEWEDDIVNTGYSQEDLISDVLGLSNKYYKFPSWLHHMYTSLSINPWSGEILALHSRDGFGFTSSPEALSYIGTPLAEPNTWTRMDYEDINTKTAWKNTRRLPAHGKCPTGKQCFNTLTLYNNYDSIWDSNKYGGGWYFTLFQHGALGVVTASHTFESNNCLEFSDNKKGDGFGKRFDTGVYPKSMVFCPSSGSRYLSSHDTQREVNFFYEGKEYKKNNSSAYFVYSNSVNDDATGSIQDGIYIPSVDRMLYLSYVKSINKMSLAYFDICKEASAGNHWDTVNPCNDPVGDLVKEINLSFIESLIYCPTNDRIYAMGESTLLQIRPDDLEIERVLSAPTGSNLFTKPGLKKFIPFYSHVNDTIYYMSNDITRNSFLFEPNY